MRLAIFSAATALVAQVLALDGAAVEPDRIVARQTGVQACYTNPAYLSCNDQMTNTACLTLAGPQQTSCACATASTVYTCFTKYCTPDDTWTGLADSLSACAALGYGSGPGPGGVPVTATPNGGGGGGSGGSTPTATAGGGAAPTTTGKNAGPMSPAPLGRDYIMTGLFGLAWIVGLAGFAL